jgi:hypothetical protein
MYASAQSLDFLATTKNPSFPIRKRLVNDGNKKEPHPGGWGSFSQKSMKCWRYHGPLFSNPSVPILLGCSNQLLWDLIGVEPLRPSPFSWGVTPRADGMTRLLS